MNKILQSLLLASTLSLCGCASLISGVTSGMAADLADTIINSDDVDTVREGVPAYLLLVDSFLRSSPDNVDLLLAASTLNGAFTVFVDEERAKTLSEKSLGYARHAGCLSTRTLCQLDVLAFDEFEAQLAQLRTDDVEAAYVLGVAWTGWIQAHSDDWVAIGQLGRVKSLLGRVVELDENWESGAAHLYLGGLETLLPASLGGRPEQGRDHFERSLELSGGKYLMTRVIYAEQYARLVFDKALHDRLLMEVIEADPVVEGMTLPNKLAQVRARELLGESDDYF
ncbi:MAG: TRAP transporter TatT component family protein [Proteobacteria bacterium]|nr:TRAP transporter TatT component family protein [Pseudomonadota bacterium]MDA1299586.1 TRAP transporter TatT component family protein [Pseudomonadota bacterium]